MATTPRSTRESEQPARRTHPPRSALGIDIGGTGIKGAPVDLVHGTLLEDRFRLDTPQPADPKAVGEVVGQVAKHFEWTGPVGITFPGVVSSGIIRTAANMDPAWIDTKAVDVLGAPLESKTAPVVLNDADAAGLAEMTHGAGRGQSGVALMLTFGTGIGSALFLDGKLLPNTELGHLELRGKDAEKRASAKVRTDKDLNWKDWAARVQEYLEDIEKLFSPDLVIIGGGVSKNPDKFLPYLSLRAHIVAAEMANTAGIIGAALAAGSKAHRA
jgi:polyphosphate glucokinase